MKTSQKYFAKDIDKRRDYISGRDIGVSLRDSLRYRMNASSQGRIRCIISFMHGLIRGFVLGYYCQ